ncbi:hypothetical protein [Halomarina rubra]|uniref:Uncharacterized protein n=1 Tax=Halomarina rubra TaxID=2071873 RepID=A0ABD6AZB1_9EURY|nr:hypothetical protein [Halomarina rubra]
MSDYVEDLDDGDASDWTFYDPNFDVQQESYDGAQRWRGTYSVGGNTTDGAPAVLAEWHPEELAGGVRLSSFEFYWNEDDISYGGGLRLLDSSGSEVLTVGSSNPGWEVSDGTGNVSVWAGDGYDRWNRFSHTFNWSAGTYSIDYYDPVADHTETGTFGLQSTLDVRTVELVNLGSDTTPVQSLSATWYDDFTFGMSGTVVDLKALWERNDPKLVFPDGTVRPPNSGVYVIDGTGAVSPLWEAVTTTTIDALNGSLDAGWNGDTGDFSSNTSEAVEGGAAVVTDTFSSTINLTSYSGDGLPAYLPKGNRLRTYLTPQNINANGPKVSIYIGREGPDEGYYGLLEFHNDVGQLTRADGDGTFNNLQGSTATSEAFSVGTTYEISYTWDDGTLGGSDGDLTFEVKNDDTDTVVLTLTGNDSTWDGNAGFRVYFWGDMSNNPLVWDWMHRVA